MRKVAAVVLALFAAWATAAPLQTYKTYQPNSQISSEGSVLLLMKGQGTNAVYAPEVNQLTGEIPVTASVGAMTATTAYKRNGVDTPPAYDTTTPANNRPLPVSLLAGDSLDVVATGAGVTSSRTLRVVLPTDQTAIPVADGGGSLTVDGTVAATQSGTWHVGNITGSVSLPTGAATAALQTTGNTSLSSIDTALDVALSTRASEATLSTLNGKVTSNFGAATGAVRAAAQLGNATGAADFGSGAFSAQTLRTVLASDQPALAVTDNGGSLTVDGTVAATQSGTWDVGDITGTVSLPTGAATSANQTTMIGHLEDIEAAVEGTLTVTADSEGLTGVAVPATATLVGGKSLVGGELTALQTDGSGRLQVAVIANVLASGASTSALQTTGNTSLSSIDTKTLAAGQATMAASSPVVIASNQTAIPITDNAGSLTVDGTVAATQSGSWSTSAVTTATGSNQAKGKTNCSALTGTYASIVTPSFNGCILHVFNSCDGVVLLSIDAGTTDYLELEAGESVSMDFCSNNRHLGSGVAIQAKDGPTAPTSGTLRISVAG